MKNSIKIITILKIITSFFPVYPMMPPEYRLLKKEDLKTVNPLSNMSGLKISYFLNGPRISDDDPLFADQGLPLSLAIIKLCEKPEDEIENKQTLKSICDAISQGTPVTSKHRIQQNLEKKLIIIRPSQESISIRKLIENWFKEKPRKRKLLEAYICLGKCKQQEKQKAEISTKVPPELIPIICSSLSNSNVDEESRTN